MSSLWQRASSPGLSGVGGQIDLACRRAKHLELNHARNEGRHAPVAVGTDPYGRMLAGIRAVRLTVLRVEAKFKYDDSNPVEHRQRVIGYLEQRDHGLDTGAAAQQRRRLAAIGDWRTPPQPDMTTA